MRAVCKPDVCAAAVAPNLASGCSAMPMQRYSGKPNMRWFVQVPNQRGNDVDHRGLHEGSGDQSERSRGDGLAGQRGTDRGRTESSFPRQVDGGPPTAGYLILQPSGVDADAHAIRSGSSVDLATRPWIMPSVTLMLTRGSRRWSRPAGRRTIGRVRLCAGETCLTLLGYARDAYGALTLLLARQVSNHTPRDCE
jgi:hypothetical protein